MVSRIKRGLDEKPVVHAVLSFGWCLRYPSLWPNLIPAFLGVPFAPFCDLDLSGYHPRITGLLPLSGLGLGAVLRAAKTPDLGIIFEPHILFPILGLCALSAIASADQSRHRQERTAEIETYQTTDILNNLAQVPAVVPSRRVRRRWGRMWSCWKGTRWVVIA